MTPVLVRAALRTNMAPMVSGALLRKTPATSSALSIPKTMQSANAANATTSGGSHSFTKNAKVVARMQKTMMR